MYTYPRSRRLLNQRDFQHVFDKPLKVTFKSFSVLYRPNALSHPRLGMVIVKRHVKRAVDRNQLRRWLREGFRHRQALLKGFDIVVLIRSKWDPIDSVSRDEIENLWQQLANTLPAH